MSLRFLSLPAVALTLASAALAQGPEIIHYNYDAGDATNTASPGAGFPTGVPGTGLTFGPGGICPGTAAGACTSNGAGADSRIDTGWNTDLGAGDWSIGCFIDMTAGAGNTNFFQYIFGDSNAGSFRSFTEGASGDGNILLRGPIAEVNINGGVSDTEPKHVCWIYDSSVPEIRGYLDGVLNVTVPQSPLNIMAAAGSPSFTVMGYNGSTSSMQSGTIMDDFRLYRRAIDQTELDSWVACASGIGSSFCMTNNNSTGVSGVLAGSGSASVAANNLSLDASSLPQNATTFFITSMAQGFTANPGGSEGNLCLGGAIGRYVGMGQIGNSGASGAYSLQIDLMNHPQPNGAVMVAAGETWNFQGWHRDAGMGGATSNFTNGLEVQFTN